MGYPLFYMDKQNHTNIMIDRINLCCYKIAKTVFYFADLFQKSYEDNPKYQRDGGDWINWTIPGTDYHLPIFQTGIGDGIYPVYLAYDKDNNVCQLIIEFIDIELAYSETDEEDEDEE